VRPRSSTGGRPPDKPSRVAAPGGHRSPLLVSAKAIRLRSEPATRSQQTRAQGQPSLSWHCARSRSGRLWEATPPGVVARQSVVVARNESGPRYVRHYQAGALRLEGFAFSKASARASETVPESSTRRSTLSYAMRRSNDSNTWRWIAGDASRSASVRSDTRELGGQFLVLGLLSLGAEDPRAPPRVLLPSVVQRCARIGEITALGRAWLRCQEIGR
jgi:hypothetical protein